MLNKCNYYYLRCLNINSFKVRSKCHKQTNTVLSAVLQVVLLLLGGGSNGTVWSMKRQNDGKIIIGGTFTTYNGASSLNVTRIFPSGSSSEAKTSAIYYQSEPDYTVAENSDMITLYPNPSNGLLYFSTKNVYQTDAKISVYNLLGQNVYSDETILNETNELNLSSLKSGTYFVSFTTKSEVITKTIIIK